MACVCSNIKKKCGKLKLWRGNKRGTKRKLLFILFYVTLFLEEKIASPLKSSIVPRGGEGPYFDIERVCGCGGG